MTLVKFYRGQKAKYNEETHVDGLYFALDTHEIIMNGVSYGYNAADHQEIEAVVYTAPDKLVITYTNGNEDTITLQTAEAGESVESSKAGLMSAADVFKLAKVESRAQVNVLETVKVNGTPLVPEDKAVNIDLSGLQSDIDRNKLTAADNSIVITDGVSKESPATIKVKVNPEGSINVTEEGLEVDQKALTQYQGDNRAIAVEDGDGNVKTVKLNLNTKTGNILTATADGLFASVKLKKLEVGPEETTLAAKYGLVGLQPDGTEINVGDVTIDIVKDKFLKDVELTTIPAEQPNAGEDALAFIFNLEDGSTKTQYVSLSTFLREAEAGNGIEFVTGLDGVKRYTIKVAATSEKNDSLVPYLQVTEEGLKLIGVNAEFTSIKSRLDALEVIPDISEDWAEPDKDE